MSQIWWNWGRVIYSVPLAITGLIYIWKPRTAVESLTSFIPGELSLIYVAGFSWIILGFMIACDIKTKYACYGVIALLSVYQIMVHIPAIYTGEYLNIVWFELLRDLSLMGGAFFILAVETQEQEADEQETHDNDSFGISLSRVRERD
ncbi:MAG TPA: hypothetical protein VEL47_08105 [Myxococcota bacterium]|nr:hypothetical protein [Myxococcota bacterium]